ncbi:MAG: FAD-binding oxidoreductase [Dehalococcoidales bacterium]|nr:FAD-binding oxidoreductase [Dehalococcoidales bacterium]
MALSRELYRALEDTIGPEYVSDDPVILDSYAWRMNRPATKFVPRFEAITLPDSTEQVQGIVKLCNKHKVQFKASSTGWGFFADPGGPGVVKIDLRRMNRIIEINEKNMYAVVEPYVIAAQLQAELMKRGLNCNITGAGSNCSGMPLAAHANLGHLSISGSYGERNLLGVEWVTPEGEIVKLGSLGSLGKWFCGDGPGPSLRGIIRGNVMPLGGLGVFTRAAQKIYHWPGPATFPLKGVSPRYVPSRITPWFMVRYLSFKNRADLTKAVEKVGESEIGFIMMGFTPGMMASNIATNNNEDIEYLKKYTAEVQGPGFMLIIAGNSANDFEYKKQVLETIRQEFNGQSLKDPEDPQKALGFIWRFTRVSGSIREVDRASGVFGGEVGCTDVFPLMQQYIVESGPIKQKYIDEGLLFDDSSSPFVQSIEHGHCGHGELLLRYNPNNPAAIEATGEIIGFANKTAIEGHFGVPGHALGEAHEEFGPHTSNYHLWLKKIKNTFDPNLVSETTHYVKPD